MPPPWPIPSGLAKARPGRRESRHLPPVNRSDWLPVSDFHPMQWRCNLEASADVGEGWDCERLFLLLVTEEAGLAIGLLAKQPGYFPVLDFDVEWTLSFSCRYS